MEGKISVKLSKTVVLFTGALLGPPIAGAIYRANEEYDIPFYTAGGFFILASLISVGAQILQRKKKEKDKLSKQISKKTQQTTELSEF